MDRERGERECGLLAKFGGHVIGVWGSICAILVGWAIIILTICIRWLKWISGVSKVPLNWYPGSAPVGGSFYNRTEVLVITEALKGQKIVFFYKINNSDNFTH